MNKLKEIVNSLTLFEKILLSVSVFSVTVSFFIFGSKNYLTLIASVIGLTAVIFCAKGYVIGQAFIIVFSVFYGIISFSRQYYGEMITYLCMSTPIAVMALVSWIKNPFGKTKEVAVSRMTKKQAITMSVLAILTTIAFYFILSALNNASLYVSVFSVFTSFIAAYMTFLRSPYYALGYAANDIVLIILWIIASLDDSSYIPMIICFLMFLINDVYGFISWQRMKRRQAMLLEGEI